MSRNVALIVLDTVRKDYFDTYATQLQNRSDTSFLNCRAASSWSVPSHASMLTEQLPHVHGIHTHDRYFDGVDREQTFLSRLPDHTAVGASANVFASATFGFDEPFDSYSDIAPHRRFPDGMDMEKFIQDREREGVGRFLEFLTTAAEHDHPLQSLGNGLAFKFDDVQLKLPIPKLTDDGAKLVRREATRKVKEATEPFFLFTNFMDAHAPLQHVFGFDSSIHGAPNSWSSRDFEQWNVILNGIDESNRADVRHHRELYAAAVEYLDRQVSAFIDEVQAATDVETTFIITADHGENLGFDGDNGLFGHTNSLTEALLHVPCEIVNPPPGYDDTYTPYLSHLQLGELLTGIASGETPVPVRESIPAEVIGSGVGDPPEGDKQYWDRMIRCAYRDNSKIEWDSEGGQYRYQLNFERPSRQELAEQNAVIPDWAASHFSGDINNTKEELSSTRPTDKISETTKNRLEELGYRE